MRLPAHWEPRIYRTAGVVMKEQAMGLLSAADRWVHRLMRGRCWNPRVCLWLSEYEAEKEVRKEKRE